MRKRNPVFANVDGLILEPTGRLSGQLYERLRDLIRSGQMPACTRLPSTRGLAEHLSISRNTVQLVYDELRNEGYIETRVGAGTRVAARLPETFMHSCLSSSAKESSTAAADQRRNIRSIRPAARPVSTFGATALRTTSWGDRGNDGVTIRFDIGAPAVDVFPYDLWVRTQTERARRGARRLMGLQDAIQFLPLREQIAAHLGVSRSVRCTADQVFVVPGSQAGLDLVARVLVDRGERACVENPCYPGAGGALLAAGATLVPVPVDAEGLCVEQAERLAPDARVAYVTASHQFPLGYTMSLRRRELLLDWAQRARAWIVEDDYDADFCYDGQPLPAIQSLDQAQSVLYVGTFSNVLFPALRIGYVIVPPCLVDVFRAARRLTDVHVPTLNQAALADFMVEGHFARHVRRLRMLYGERRAALLEAIARFGDGWLTPLPSLGGTCIAVQLPPGIDDRLSAERAAEFSVRARPLSAFALERPPVAGFALGFSSLDRPQLEDGVRRLAAAVQSVAKSPRGAAAPDGCQSGVGRMRIVAQGGHGPAR